MALKPQTSFSGGELDPTLHERVTLERFNSALATARNIMITKLGTLKSRFGKFFFHLAFHSGKPIRVYSPPNSGVILEFGKYYDEDILQESNYLVLYDFSGNILADYTAVNSSLTNFTEESLKKLHFVTTKDYVYVFRGFVPFAQRNVIFRVKYTSAYAVEDADLFELPYLTGSPSYSYTANGSGYQVDYAYAPVVDGQEILERYITGVTAFKKPIAATERNEIIFTIGTNPAEIDRINEVRIYQRPTTGAGYGYLGRTTEIYVDAGVIKAKFTDVGANPDYENGIQTFVGRDGLGKYYNLDSYGVETGTVYQQRMLLANFEFNPTTPIDREAIIASRPGFINNFYRDRPLSADSSLLFKAGTSGNANVLRMVDDNGLVVFTTIGVFVSQGVLGPNNLALVKRGPWIIDEDIPPLVIPGGLFFVDKITSTVRQLVYSQELGGFDSVEQSIFSDHLFRERTISSWAYQQGASQMIIVCFSDGTFATFTYSFEQQMKAWTRHDSTYPVEQVEGTSIPDTTIFVINKNGERQIEMTIPRDIPASVKSVNTEAEYLAFGAFMDGLKVTVDILNDDIMDDSLLVLVATDDDWSADLQLLCGTSNIFSTAEVGDVFRFFHPKDKSRIDLEVISLVDDNEVIVRPSEEFPSDYAYDIKLYKTHTTLTGLDHLDNEEVSVMCDGDMISSPYNDNSEDTLSILTVIGGELDLPNRSAITVVGRPIIADTKSLNITTVEQAPTVIESLTVNKVYVRVKDTRGLFIANQFPEELENEVDGTSVKDMQTLDDYYVPENTPIVGNRAKPPTSKRCEVTLAGTWQSNGQIAIRQVDPFHFEILSIIADVEILRRSDR